MERPTGVQISRFLKSRGVQYIFGIPGVHNQELYRGIDEAGLTHILARHEQVLVSWQMVMQELAENQALFMSLRDPAFVMF